MRLVIFDQEDKYDEDFINWLMNEMHDYFYIKLDKRKLVNLEDEINQTYKSIYRPHISAEEVLDAGMENLQYEMYPGRIIIDINPNQTVFGTTAKLLEICKLINYGTLINKGYPIFTDMFTYFDKRIDDFYTLYINRGTK